MAGFVWFRKLYFIKQKIAVHFQMHKTLYIIGLICFLLGFITGIFSGIKYADVVAYEHISDTTLVNYLSHNASIVGLFFSRFIAYFFLLILLFFLHGIVWLAPLGFLFLVYKSFLYGVTITFFIILCGLGGVLLTLFVLLPVCILVTTAFLVLVTTCVSRSVLCKKYGGAYICNDAPNFLIGTLYVAVILLLLACFLEFLILPIISTTIIIII
jgi:hypothetical protein